MIQTPHFIKLSDNLIQKALKWSNKKSTHAQVDIHIIAKQKHRYSENSPSYK